MIMFGCALMLRPIRDERLCLHQMLVQMERFD